MKRRYVTVDVFTTTKLQGNPVAVVLDAEGLSTAQMQSIAAEFVYSETTFVLPPRDDANTACVRIFTPSREIPFAGHPNVGTAYALAIGAKGSRETQVDQLRFEELAGLVPVRILRDGDTVSGAELTTPEALSRHAAVEPAMVAACLSLSAADILTAAHAPCVASVGLPFLVVELASAEALSRCIPDPTAYKRVLPLHGATSVYAYTQDGVPASAAETAGSPTRMCISARMFTPRMTEDPATGSAAAATAALLASVHGRSALSVKVSQGVAMGRSSSIDVSVDTTGGGSLIRVAGHCVKAMEGFFELVGEA